MVDRMGNTAPAKPRTARGIREERMRQDPDFRAYWARTTLAQAVALAVVKYHAEHNLSQADLAERLRTRQSNVARLEAGEHTPTLETLLRLSSVLGREFFIHVAPTEHHGRWPEREEHARKVVEVADSSDPPSAVLLAAG